MCKAQRGQSHWLNRGASRLAWYGTGPREGVSVVGGWLGSDEAWGQPMIEWAARKLQEEKVRAAATFPAYPTFQSLIRAAGPSC